MTDDEEIAKAIGQFRLQVIVALQPFDMYGLGIFVPGAVDAIEGLAHQLIARLDGHDIPIGRSQ